MNRGVVLSLVCIVFAGWLSAGHPSQAATKAERLRAAEALTREALHREIYGLDEERERLLEEASGMLSDFEPAKWHQGMVQYNRQWINAEELPAHLDGEQRVADYRLVRQRYGQTVEDQLTLANWCARRGLQDRERAHLTQVVSLSPDHAEARRRLGFRRVGPDWVLEDELQQAEQAARANQAAVERWRPQLEEIRRQLHNRGQLQREKAAERLLAISDPQAAVAIEAILWNDSEEAAQLMVEALGDLPGHDVALILARQSAASPFETVRRSAAEQLQQRDLDSYVPALLSIMYTPATSRTDVFRTRDGRLLYRYAVQREGQNQHESLVLDTFYRREALPGGDEDETLARAVDLARTTNLNREVAIIQHNLRTMEMNDRIGSALNTATDQQLPAHPDSWWQWWNETNEVFIEGEKPVKEVHLSDEVTLVDRVDSLNSASRGADSSAGPPPMRMDCLAAGTLVWTDAGPIAIETIRVGDLVLAQDPETGELAYKPVLRTTVRPLGPLVQVHLVDREFVETSGGHLFWAAGEGWTRARQLESGMTLHGLDGTRRVSYTETGSEAETYNLIVADFHTYFVGESKVLCHDNTVRRPTSCIVPGLSEAR
jgi:hypothetical protein